MNHSTKFGGSNDYVAPPLLLHGVRGLEQMPRGSLVPGERRSRQSWPPRGSNLPSAVGFGPRRIGHVSVLPRGRGWLLCSLVSVCWTGRTATNRDMPSPKRSSPFLAGVAFAKLKPRSEGYFLFYPHFLSGSETDQPCYRTIFPTSKFNWGNVGPIPGSAKRETCCTTSASPPN